MIYTTRGKWTTVGGGTALTNDQLAAWLYTFAFEPNCAFNEEQREHLQDAAQRLMGEASEERDQFAEQAAQRDQRDADIQEIMRINNDLRAELQKLRGAGRHATAHEEDR